MLREVNVSGLSSDKNLRRNRNEIPIIPVRGSTKREKNRALVGWLFFFFRKTFFWIVNFEKGLTKSRKILDLRIEYLLYECMVANKCVEK